MHHKFKNGFCLKKTLFTKLIFLITFAAAGNIFANNAVIYNASSQDLTVQSANKISGLNTGDIIKKFTKKTFDFNLDSKTCANGTGAPYPSITFSNGFFLRFYVSGTWVSMPNPHCDANAYQYYGNKEALVAQIKTNHDVAKLYAPLGWAENPWDFGVSKDGNGNPRKPIVIFDSY